LLAADTFSHHRLANPTPADGQHFETFHVNLRPTYHSMYPPAQAMFLAVGQIFFAQPWIGVYLSTALMCGVIFWALAGFFAPGWALLGGLMAVSRFALFGYWINSYWGGSVPALGGALALGAVVRLGRPGCTIGGRAWLSTVFAAGLGLLANSRPYEGLAFALPLVAYFIYHSLSGGLNKKQLAALVLPALTLGLAGVAFLGLYNHATTGDALLMPYSLNHRVYWPLPFFVGQRENAAVQRNDPVFVKFFESTAQAYEYNQTKSFSGMVGIEASRILENWLFYVGPALTFPVILGLLASLRQVRLRIALASFITMALALAVCLYNLPHYFSPATVLIYIFAIAGLQYLWSSGQTGERAFALAACLTFLVTSVTGRTAGATLYANYALPDARRVVSQRLEARPGRYLVLVSYDLARHYPGDELVHNGADFTSEKILWARSKGRDADAHLCSAYWDRTFVEVWSDDVSISFRPLDLCR
jgi:hypothetical protein